jgi:hypothetical protein
MLCDAPALIHTLRLSQGRGLTVRPVCPRDAGLVQAFVRGLSPAARYSGCFGPLQDLSPDQTRTRHTSRPSQGDGFDREGRRWRHAAYDRRSALRDRVRWREFWVRAVRERRLAGPGGGTRLLADLERRTGSCGAITLVGNVLRFNEAMKALAGKAGFDLTDPHAKISFVHQRFRSTHGTIRWTDRDRSPISHRAA